MPCTLVLLFIHAITFDFDNFTMKLKHTKVYAAAQVSQIALAVATSYMLGTLSYPLRFIKYIAANRPIIANKNSKPGGVV
jgi:hypothetical protein